MRSRDCLCVYTPIVARQRLGKNPLTIPSQRLGKNPPIIARQRLGRKVTAVTNTNATIEELSDASFSMWSVSYEGKQAISSSQNFLFFLFFYNTGRWSKSKNPVIPKVIHHRQNPLESTRKRKYIVLNSFHYSKYRHVTLAAIY
jgi:hypothetical protein